MDPAPPEPPASRARAALAPLAVPLEQLLDLSACDALPPADAERSLGPLVSALQLAPRAEALAVAFARALLLARKSEAAARVLRWVQAQRSLGTAEATPDDGAWPALPSVSVMLARAQAASGDLASATGTLEAVLRGDPDGSTAEGRGAAPLLKGLRAAGAAKDRANALYKDGKHEEAAAEYRAAISVFAQRCGGPGLSQLHANLAAALVTLGRHEEAAGECRAALALSPVNAKAWQRLATCLLAAKPVTPAGAEGATAALEAFLFLSSDDAGAGKALARARAQHGGGGDDDAAQLILQAPRSDSEYSSLFARSAGAKRHGARLFSLFGARAEPPLPPRLLLVDYFATWCGPCKQISPVFEATARGGAVAAFAKVDGDKCKGAAMQPGGAAAAASAAAAAAKGKGAACAGGGCGSGSGCGSGGGGGCGSGGGGCGSGGGKSSGGGGCCGGGGGGGCGGGASSASGPGSAVRAYPTFIAFLDGAEIGRFEGADASKLGEFVRDSQAAWRRAPPLPAGGIAPAPLIEALSAIDGRGDVGAQLAHAMALNGVGR